MSRRLLRWHTESVFGPASRTDGWQPVDRGHVGALLKQWARQDQAVWLEDDDNFQKWENGKLSAKEKRVLCTKWFGAAWRKLKAHPAVVERAFAATGCGCDMLGHTDADISVVGLKNPIEMVKVEEPFIDDADEYKNRAWSCAEHFLFADKEESDSSEEEASSSSDSASSSDSSGEGGD